MASDNRLNFAIDRVFLRVFRTRIECSEQLRRWLRIVIILAAQLGATHAFADFGGLDGYIEIETFIVIGEDEANVIAILSNEDENPEVRVYPERGGDPSLVVELNPNFVYFDLEPVVEDGITTDLALLARSRTGNGVRVFRVNLESGSATSVEPFGPTYDAIDLEMGESANGESIAYVLARSKSNGRSRVLYFQDSQRRQFPIEQFIEANDLELMLDPVTGSSWMLVLGDVPATQATRVNTYEIANGRRINTMSFGRHRALDFSIATLGQQTAISVLRARPSNGPIVVESKSIDGTRLDLVTFDDSRLPLQLLSRSSTDQLIRPGVLVVDPESESTSVLFNDSGSAEPLQSVNFGSGSHSGSVVELPGTLGAPSLIVAGQRHKLSNSLQLKVRTSSDRRRVTIPWNTVERIPDWFDLVRVHGHTRLSDVDQRLGLDRSWFQTDQSVNAGSYFQEIGAPVFTRHAKASNEDPWWASEAPLGSDGNSRYANARANKGLELPINANLTQGYVDEAWRSDMPMFAYYADSGEMTLADENSDWVCRDDDGDIASHVTKGRYLDLTTEYGNIVEARILELADMGASGVYLDFRHMPPNGCWSTKLALDFTAAVGSEAPEIGNTEVYRQFVEYYAGRVVEVIEGWNQAVKAEYPEFQMLVSVTSVPALTRMDMSSRLAAIGTPKTEFASAVARGQSNSVFQRFPELPKPPDDVRMALGWSLLRDVAEENLYHVWIAFMPNGDHVRAFVSSVIAYGGVAALDVVEELLTPGSEYSGIASREELRGGYSLGRSLSAPMVDSSPVRWAAIHFSESARNSFVTNTREAWSSSLLATVGSFEALRRQGIPVKIVTDEMLSEGKLEGVSFLVIPNPELLSDDAMAAIQSYETNGRFVYRMSSAFDWATVSGYAAGINQVRESALSMPSPPAVYSSNLPEGVHLTLRQSSDRSTLVATVVNEFDFVQASTIFDPVPLAEVNPKPPLVNAGITFFVEQGAIGLLSASMVSQVTDAANGVDIPYETVDDGIVVTLPEFDQVMQVIIQ